MYTPGGRLNRLKHALVRGLGLSQLLTARNAPALAIITYHCVHPLPADRRNPVLRRLVSPTAFERQLVALKSHFQILPLPEAATALFAGDLKQTTACITFDDGYRDNLFRALPILERLQIPATVFLCTNFIDKQRPFWPDLLWHLVADRADAVTVYDELARTLCRLPPKQRDTKLAELGNAADFSPSWLPMNWSEARQLAASKLITIGSHGHQHIEGAATAVADFRQDTLTAQRLIRDRLGLRPTVYAYPNGSMHPQAESILAAAGLDVACSSDWGDNPVAGPPSRFALRRLGAQGHENGASVLNKVAGLYKLRSGNA